MTYCHCPHPTSDSYPLTQAPWGQDIVSIGQHCTTALLPLHGLLILHTAHYIKLFPQLCTVSVLHSATCRSPDSVSVSGGR